MRRLDTRGDVLLRPHIPALPCPRHEDVAADNSHMPPVQVRRSARPIATGYADLVAAAIRPAEQAYGQMEQAYGADFSNVRISQNSDRARSLGATAFTQGDEIHFAPGHWAPETATGRELLAHELGHVIQQRQGRVHANANLDGAAINNDPALERDADAQARRAISGQSPAHNGSSGRSPHAAPVIQQYIEPEAVASEMSGRLFDLTGPYGTLKVGAIVKCKQWFNDLPSVQVVPHPAPALPVILLIPKSLLAPHRQSVSGIDPYSADIEGQRATVVKSEREVAEWEAKRGDYKTPAQKKEFETERSRRQGLANKRQQVLNRRLIQETMFNRFDEAIVKEVQRQNNAHGLKGADALDPDMVKSMIFQESQMGTSGKYLSEPATSIVMTRFNIGQVVDSSAIAHLTYFEANNPTNLVAWGMSNWRTDLNAAQLELRSLQKNPPADPTRLNELIRLSGRYWETFLWEYKGTGVQTFMDRLVSVFSKTRENYNYEYWIKMMVFWLFEKYKQTKSWPAAIRNYNGSDKYRDAVVTRASEAAASAKAKQPYVPKKI